MNRAESGNLGDYKAIGKDLFELRCFFGGGNKSNQDRDIEKAKQILDNLETGFDDMDDDIPF